MMENVEELKHDLNDVKEGLDCVKDMLKIIKDDLNRLESKSLIQEAIKFSSKVKLPKVYIPKVKITTPKFNVMVKRQGA